MSIVALLLASLLPSTCEAAVGTGSHSAAEPHKGMLSLPPRLMWGDNLQGVSGFCGETSLQTAGIYYGNWLTAEYVRGTSGGYNGKHQLLIGPTGKTSILHACKQLRLDCAQWDWLLTRKPQSHEFLSWATGGIDAGFPVIIAVYWSMEDIVQGYDHIVPMVGYDENGIYMNDLSKNNTQFFAVPDFVRSRKDCHPDQHSPDFCMPYNVDYGIQVRGNADTMHELLPVRMSVSSWTEPDYSQEDRLHEKPIQLSATLTVSKLSAGSRYALLRYEDPLAVPEQGFLASGGFEEKTEFVAAGSTHTFATTFMSDSTILYRCVPAGGQRDKGVATLV